MPRLIRQSTSPSFRRPQFGVPDVLPDGNSSSSNVCQPQRSISTVRNTRNINTAKKEDRKFRVFLTAVDDRMDAVSHTTWSGPPLLFDVDALRANFSSLKLAARMTLMFADEVCFSPSTGNGKRPEWDHEALTDSALTFLKTWDVQYRCDVLPWQSMTEA